ncbi:zinc finger protein 25-like [Anthonomus grandis grandis]|uniref:zinc finger protein 25-like n=1 Tax=Anthonomus grandis grandis TaxID=2921223 RepID=UPI0021666CD8|nr:zinc finger protein 25-like [Anthonomus grandis grandis]
MSNTDLSAVMENATELQELHNASLYTQTDGKTQTEDTALEDHSTLITISEENIESSPTDTVALCETLYEGEHSGEYSSVHIEGTDGEYYVVKQEPSETSILEGLPNDALVFCCQPESDNLINMFPCKLCGRVTGCIFCLKSHYESIHLNLGLIQYKCNQMTYMRNYTEICHKCNLVCESRQEMFDHRKIHFVTCEVCDMSFDNALFLSNHCKTFHQKFEVIISCDLCEQWFKQLQDLSTHYQTYHEMILCIVCFKRFSAISELTEHHKTHKIVLTDDVNPMYPYACSKCNQAFSQICELSVHLVRDHPKNKVAPGNVVKKDQPVNVNVKRRKKKDSVVQFDDCGGLRECEGANPSPNLVKKAVKKKKR